MMRNKLYTLNDFSFPFTMLDKMVNYQCFERNFFPDNKITTGCM